MSRFSTSPLTREGEPLVELRDTQTGAYARIWPGFGNNCLTAVLPSPAPEGGLIDILLGPESLDQVREQPSWWGVPLLFPWPGRIPAGEYEFGGRQYKLPAAEMGGNAGHGFVKTHAWTIATQTANDGGAALISTFDSADYPETLEGFPFPYRVAAEYRLDTGGLSLQFTVTNTGQGPLPFGYGPHPYFRLPLGPAGSPAECRVHVPGARRWDGQRVAAVRKTGAIPWDDLAPRVSGDHDLRTPQPLAERLYDGVYTELTQRDGLVECSVSDPINGVEAVMRATPNFPNVVVYTPAGRPGVCFEPWTCPPNVFNLAAAGIAQSGLIVLDPGHQWESTVWLSLRPSHNQGETLRGASSHGGAQRSLGTA